MQSDFHILCLWQIGLFDYKYCCNTPHVNANQLGYLQWCKVTWPCITAMMHGRSSTRSSFVRSGSQLAMRQLSLPAMPRRQHITNSCYFPTNTIKQFTIRTSHAHVLIIRKFILFITLPHNAMCTGGINTHEGSSIVTLCCIIFKLFIIHL